MTATKHYGRKFAYHHADRGLRDVLARARRTTTGDQLTEMKSRLFLDVVVGEGPAVLKLLAGEDQALLVGRDTVGKILAEF